jgi:hypothetical protein
MELIIGGIVTGILATFILSFSLGRISNGLVIIAEIVGAGAIVYFGFIQQVVSMSFAISLIASYLVSSFIIGWIMASLDD